jgi:CheY-like chemotaxis protein
MAVETMDLNKFLLVKDDPQAVQITMAGLEKNHLTKKFAVVNNGEEALDYLYRRGRYKNRRTGDPTLVLLDNKLSKASGLEVLKTMKLDERLKAIPVVVLTSWRTAPDLIEFFRHGAKAYAVKSLGFSQFIRAVKRLDVLWAAVSEPPPVPEGGSGSASG